VLQGNEVLLNPTSPVSAAQRVKELAKKGAIKIKGDLDKVIKEITVELRRAKSEGKKSVALSDLIDYTIEDLKGLGETLGTVPKDTENPFTGVVDKNTYDKVSNVLEFLLGDLPKINTTR
jgi:hypothetical protein